MLTLIFFLFSACEENIQSTKRFEKIDFELIDFNPKIGEEYSHIVLQLMYLPGLKDTVRVKLGDLNCNIVDIYYTDDIIINILTYVPENATTNKLSVIYDGKEYQYEEDFVVIDTTEDIYPVITDFNPKIARIGDTIDVNITKTNFRLRDVTFYIGDLFSSKQRVINDKDTNTYKIVIPDSAKSDYIIADFGKFKIKSSEKFTVYQITDPPIVESFSPTQALPGDQITINGNYFQPDTNKTKVFFGNKESKILNITENVIECVVPDINEDEIIKVKTTLGETQFNEKFKLLHIIICNFTYDNIMIDYIEKWDYRSDSVRKRKYLDVPFMQATGKRRISDNFYTIITKYKDYRPHQFGEEWAKSRYKFYLDTLNLIIDSLEIEHRYEISISGMSGWWGFYNYYFKFKNVKLEKDQNVYKCNIKYYNIDSASYIYAYNPPYEPVVLIKYLDKIVPFGDEGKMEFTIEIK